MGGGKGAADEVRLQAVSKLGKQRQTQVETYQRAIPAFLTYALKETRHALKETRHALKRDKAMP